MISLEEYTEEFKQQYYEKVKSKISETDMKRIVSSSKKFLPKNFYYTSKKDNFKELILAPFSKIKEAKEYIENITFSVMDKECFGMDAQRKVNRTVQLSPYNQLCINFESIMRALDNKETIRVRIAKNNGKLTVCPFCNRDYINSRGGNRSGAQIDHFYPRANYPIFSLSLYNLIPICGNCNRIKSNSNAGFVSPWDENMDWNKAIRFSYEIEQVDSYKVVIEAEGDARNNIEEMQIQDAYSIHSIEVEELLEKQRYYSETQKEEIKNILKDISISDTDIKRAIFGPEITADKIRTKSLGKMTRDLHKKLGIY